MNTSRWAHSIDKTTLDFITAFGHLNEQELNWKPDPQIWSVGQNIHHLIVINQTYFDLIQKVRDSKYTLHWLSRFGWIVNFFGKFILKSVQPDRKNKIKTFPIWEPSASNIERNILMQFKQHQDALKKLIEDCNDLLDQEQVIASPANKLIVYKLETAFDIIVAHEQRHLEQARQVLETDR